MHGSSSRYINTTPLDFNTVEPLSGSQTLLCTRMRLSIMRKGLGTRLLSNKHIGTDHFVHYRVYPLLGGKLSIGWCIGKRPLYKGVPLFRVSFIGSSTVLDQPVPH